MVPAPRHLVAVIICVGLAGCTTEPDGSTLRGRYANRHFEVTATTAAAQVRLPCGSATTGPLLLDGTRVSASGTYYSYAWDPGPSRFDVYGELRADTLLLYTVIKGWSDGPNVLHRDSVADFSDIGCLAGR